MEHLPPPHNSLWKQMEVPVYTYSGGRYHYSPPWDSYAQRQNYHEHSEFFVLEPSVESSYPEHLKPQLAAFIQSWLYFGVISEFLQVPPDTCDFIENTGSEKSNEKEEPYHKVTTARLRPMLDDWISRMQNATAHDNANESHRIQLLLVHASVRYAAVSVSIADTSRPSELLPPLLLLSIEVLYATLSLACNCAFPNPIMSPNISRSNFRVLQDRMVHDGWCPSEIRRLRRDHSIITQYSCSFLGKVQHNLDHSKCSQMKCLASQIDHNTYQTRHVEPECRCRSSSAANHQIAAVLRDNMTPVIRLNSAGIDLEVSAVDLKTEPQLSYIAISHVWSDGLGNLKQNTLPLCQLRKIQEQVNLMSPPDILSENSHFWLDTICVPVGENLKFERNLAIAQMAAVYRCAEKTLILSEELRNVSSDRNAWELSARINRTAWFGRLWTLHEAVLSRKLCFQLEDVAVDLHDVASALVHQKMSQLSAAMHQHMFFETSTPFLEMNKFRRMPTRERCQEIWSAVHSRSTSNREDETICLANMLELDITPILAVDRNDPDASGKRMLAFILQQKFFPRSLPFETFYNTRPGLTLDDPGFRWAPRSFVFREPDRAVRSSATTLALASSKGLHIEAAGIDVGYNWQNFLALIWTKAPLFSEVEAPSLANTLSEINFMVPFQWDVHYSLYWDVRHKWPLTKEIIETTRPVILLQRNLPDEEIDLRQLRTATGRRIRGFCLDVLPEFEFYDAAVSPEWCSALVVAVPKDDSVGSAEEAVQQERQVTLITTAHVTKSQFIGSDSPIWKQLLFPDQGTALEKVALFSVLPETSAWCVG